MGEAELIGAFREGQVADFARGGARGRVDAALLRRCCLELKGQIDPRGINLRNAVRASANRPNDGCLRLLRSYQPRR